MNNYICRTDLCYQDFPNICRICLNSGESGNLCNIFESKLLNVFKTITNIELDEADILPENICRTCINQLEEILLFIEKCKTSDTVLKNISKEKTRKEVIKEHESYEFKNENDFDTNCDDPDFDPLNDAAIFSSDIKSRVTTLLPSVSPENNATLVDPLISNSLNNQNKRYECPACLEKFSSARGLWRHAITSHKGVKPFICDLCSKGFSRKRTLDEHMNYHTGKTPYVCEHCGKGFKGSPGLAAHIYHTHDLNTEKIPKDKRKYTEKRVHLNLECDICGKIYASRSGFATHQLMHKGVKKYLCNICGWKFRTNAVLQNHMSTHTGEKQFECKECGKGFRQKILLYKHMYDHTTDKCLNCLRCDKKFDTKTELEDHLLTHSEEKTLECPKCNKRFRLKNALHNHLLNHRDAKPYKCNTCDKVFQSQAHLNDHLRVHTGEKPFWCGVCGKRLARTQSLKVHMRQHTGETPYVCSVCDKGYHDPSNFRKHVKSHFSSEKNVNKGTSVKDVEESSQVDQEKD